MWRSIKLWGAFNPRIKSSSVQRNQVRRVRLWKRTASNKMDIDPVGDPAVLCVCVCVLSRHHVETRRATGGSAHRTTFKLSNRVWTLLTSSVWGFNSTCRERKSNRFRTKMAWSSTPLLLLLLKASEQYRTEPNRTGVTHQDHTINFTFSDVTHLIWEFPGFYLSLKVDFQPFIAADASIKGPVCSFSNSRILIFTLLMTSQDKNSEIFMIPISA